MASDGGFVGRYNRDGIQVTPFLNCLKVVATIQEGGLEVGENLHLCTSSEEFGPVTSNGYLTLTERVLQFVDGYGNADDAAITAAIIGMAKNLNLRVIAEGVENEAQSSFLRAHQCDEIQGYYFSRPLSANRVAEMLRGNKIEFAPSPRRAETIHLGRDSNAHTSVTDRIAS